jgi:hypothetical protein
VSGSLDENVHIRTLLLTLDPTASDALRRMLIRDQADRDLVNELNWWQMMFASGTLGRR